MNSEMNDAITKLKKLPKKLWIPIPYQMPTDNPRSSSVKLFIGDKNISNYIYSQLQSVNIVERDCQKRFCQVSSQLGQLRWLLCLQNDLYKSRVELPLSCPSSNSSRYVYREENLPNSAFHSVIIIHLRMLIIY